MTQYSFEIFLIVITALFFLKAPIPFSFFAATFVYLLIENIPAGAAAEKLITGLSDRYVLMAVPLFIFTANAMNNGTVTERLFDFANHLVGPARGGLAKVNVVANMIFAGMTGSAMADAAGMGAMEIRGMKKVGYTAEYSCAITAASAVMGPIIPPSIPMVLYAMLSGASVGQLFLGGVVPGVMLGVALIAFISFSAERRGFPRGQRTTIKATLKVGLSAFPALLTPVILLGAIYSGVMTPTEAAAAAGLYALIISVFVYRAMGVSGLIDTFKTSVKQTGAIAIIIGAASGVTYVVSNERIPDVIANSILTITTDPNIFLMIINVVFLLLGMFVSQSVIMLVFVPIVLPAVNALGIDLVHFGVVIVVNMMIGLTTPPYGGLLFVTSSVSGTPLRGIIKEIVPFIGVMMVVLLIITYIPQTVTFLPSLFD